MAKTVEELTCEWTNDAGEVLTRQLDKVVLTKGAWATILYLFQDRSRATAEFSKAKVRIQRYQKRNGEYRPHSKFNISSTDQGRKIAKILDDWADKHPK